MDVAVKIMLFQNTTRAAAAAAASATDDGVGFKEGAGCCTRALARKRRVLQEAALCCSMSHPNVVATYNYDVMVASGFHKAPSGLTIADESGEGAFKLALIQVGQPTMSWEVQAVFFSGNS